MPIAKGFDFRIKIAAWQRPDERSWATNRDKHLKMSPPMAAACGILAALLVIQPSQTA